MIASSLLEFRRYMALAEGALAQVDDEALWVEDGPGGNSIAILTQHMAGNLRSRFTDFLSSDGEKPWRDRDAEFAALTHTRSELMAAWQQGWETLFSTLESLTDEDLQRTVQIRGLPLTVDAALQRSLAHVAYHVGQLVLLARRAVGAGWASLSIPSGRSKAYNLNPTLETGPQGGAVAQSSAEHSSGLAGQPEVDEALHASDYDTEQRETIAELPGLRIRLLALGPGQSVPWHLHTEIRDTFFCMDGPMQVRTRDPDGSHILAPGDSLAVEAGTSHEVTPAAAGGACRFMIVQGVGTYDYVPVESPD